MREALFVRQWVNLPVLPKFPRHQRGARLAGILVQNSGDVLLDHPRADTEDGGDFGIGSTGEQVGHHFPLSRREVGVVHLDERIERQVLGCDDEMLAENHQKSLIAEGRRGRQGDAESKGVEAGQGDCESRAVRSLGLVRSVRSLRVEHGTRA